MAVLKEKHKNYVWRKPRRCPSCQSFRIWGHGYVLRYFDEFPEGLYLKRFRCPECGAVHTARPVAYFPRFQSTATEIYRSLSHKLESHTWFTSFSRQRQQYWYRGLMKQAAIQGLNFDLSLFLSDSVQNRFCFPSHSINHDVKSVALCMTYLSFAVTTNKIPP